MNAPAKLKFKFVVVEQGRRVGELDASGNKLKQIEAPGFLDKFLQEQKIGFQASDILIALCSDGEKWYRPEVTNGSTTLKELS